MEKEVGNKVLSAIKSGLGDSIGKETIEDLAGKIGRAVKNQSEDIWSDIGESITSGSMTKDMVKELFNKDSINLMKESGLGDDLAKGLKKRMPRVMEGNKAREAIVKNLPNELKDKGVDFVKNLDIDSSNMTDLIKNNEKGILGSAIKNNLSEDIIEKGLSMESISDMLGVENKLFEKGKVYAEMSKSRLGKMKSSRYDSVKDMANYNFAGEIKARDLKGISGEGISNIGREVSSRAANPTVADNLLYNKIPEKAAGGASLAFLVQNMSTSRGHMTNSELYGQKNPYER